MTNAPPTPSPDEIAAKLHAYAPRLIRESLHALALYEVWNELNTPTQARDALVASPVTKAVGVMWEATLDKLVLVLMRALDSPGRGKNIHASDRVSYPVVRQLLDEPGVLDVLVKGAMLSDDADRREAQGQAVREAASRLGQRLDKLESETPSGTRRLRAIRDRFLAHQLHLVDSIDPPIHQNLKTLTNELLALAEDTQRVLAPTVIFWPRGDLAAETKLLVKTIAEHFPLAQTGR